MRHHELVRVYTVTLLDYQENQVAETKPGRILQETSHSHRSRHSEKTQVRQVSYHFPFPLDSIRCLRRLELLLPPKASFPVSSRRPVKRPNRRTCLRPSFLRRRSWEFLFPSYTSQRLAEGRSTLFPS